ncbi:hypothetical protein MUK60_07430 [Streptomyces sp. LRE541]|uniref:hypothetical protein n=1 Tax=Streptomyces sp. LRE541 TaxID=2931983 RepID=UPI00200D240D|nr:hypothetical protein [Streptomyces sp. LRE541]UPZ27664.1 hypothetical protein MUK60_07430 [Streptomyces sp. LRE541]
MPQPTPEEIQEAGRQLQRGGLLGAGSSKYADRIVEEAVAAGANEQDVAMQILSAAADYEPRPWAR